MNDIAKSAETWLGRRMTADVQRVAHGGHCVARVEGRVVFVRHALPGEQVVVEITEDAGGSFCRGDAVEVLRASADRVTPPCPLAAPGRCGGCDWQHANPSAQRDLKAAVLAEQLLRLSGTDIEPVVEPLPGGPLRWRTRLRLAVDQDGRAGLRAHRSHQVLALDDCPIAVRGLLDGVVSERWTPGSELEVTLDDAGQRHVAEQVREPGSRRVRTHWHRGGSATWHAAGRQWTTRADGFWQVHPAAAQVLADVVGEWAAASAGATAWDLYGGAGLFAAVLAGQVGPEGAVVLVESSRAAAADARRNLADLAQVRCVADRVERALSAKLSETDPPEVVVLDPPRKGAGHAVVDAIAAARPERVVYVACDPAALARDVARFAGHGFRLARLRAFDAFPMTHHLESVALLHR